MSNDTRITAFKGFDKNLACRGYQYELGKTYEHEGKVVRCASGGFHSCEYPLDVFGYYAPAESRYAVVVAHGDIDRKEGGDTKLASGKITIEAEIKVPQLIKSAVEWIMARVDKANGATATEERSHASNTGDYSAASNTGYGSAASNTGYGSAASNTGARSAASNTGDYSAASNTGDYSAASNTGARSAASNTGYGSAASNTGARSAASNTGDYSAASNTGARSAASNTGARSAASNTGDYSAASVSGKDSVAMASGYQGRARASAGSAIVLCYRDDDFKLVHIRSAIAGQDGVKPDTWYRLAADGAFIEVPDDQE
ncbi:hypothetical protein LMG26857_01775 [Achromobacter anxifer]|uniref:DUF7666 domain-containing protein n=1 Tax=Achromobacter anxifer TaxID=1287737 RepID=UPI00155BE07E|nr:hypothetical protein [Achromobacter anxifer]CAB5512485.1 hypothetical protein LMG26857_01775 [Achromobacter anxifer]